MKKKTFDSFLDLQITLHYKKTGIIIKYYKRYLKVKIYVLVGPLSFFISITIMNVISSVNTIS